MQSVLRQLLHRAREASLMFSVLIVDLWRKMQSSEMTYYEPVPIYGELER